VTSWPTSPQNTIPKTTAMTHPAINAPTTLTTMSPSAPYQ
jgi:hypothetical protein